MKKITITDREFMKVAAKIATIMNPEDDMSKFIEYGSFAAGMAVEIFEDGEEVDE